MISIQRKKLQCRSSGSFKSSTVKKISSASICISGIVNFPGSFSIKPEIHCIKISILIPTVKIRNKHFQTLPFCTWIILCASARSCACVIACIIHIKNFCQFQRIDCIFILLQHFVCPVYIHLICIAIGIVIRLDINHFPQTGIFICTSFKAQIIHRITEFFCKLFVFLFFIT